MNKKKNELPLDVIHDTHLEDLIKPGYTEPVEILKTLVKENPYAEGGSLGFYGYVCKYCGARSGIAMPTVDNPGGSTNESHFDDCIWQRAKNYLVKMGYIHAD